MGVPDQTPGRKASADKLPRVPAPPEWVINRILNFPKLLASRGNISPGYRQQLLHEQADFMVHQLFDYVPFLAQDSNLFREVVSVERMLRQSFIQLRGTYPSAVFDLAHLIRRVQDTNRRIEREARAVREAQRRAERMELLAARKEARRMEQLRNRISLRVRKAKDAKNPPASVESDSDSGSNVSTQTQPSATPTVSGNGPVIQYLGELIHRLADLEVAQAAPSPSALPAVVQDTTPRPFIDTGANVHVPIVSTLSQTAVFMGELNDGPSHALEAPTPSSSPIPVRRIQSIARELREEETRPQSRRAQATTSNSPLNPASSRSSSRPPRRPRSSIKSRSSSRNNQPSARSSEVS
ncbi:hypothetical protein C8F01DRAFT_1376822, partial [Mycena amicta]